MASPSLSATCLAALSLPPAVLGAAARKQYLDDLRLMAGRADAAAVKESLHGAGGSIEYMQGLECASYV